MSWLAVGLLSVGLLAAPGRPAAAQSVDPFYQSLYDDASRSAAAGRYNAAAKDFRLACFGMLDLPVRLGDCLARLAVAQAESGAGDELDETVRRLVDVERRFQGYSRAALPAALKRQLESHLERTAPTESLAGVAAFKDVAARRRAAEIRAMAPDEQARALQLEISQDPTNATWQVLRGDMLLVAGNATEAAEVADSAAVGAPQDPRVACLRGRAQATLGACGGRTTEDLRRCAGVEPDAARQARHLTLECLVGRGDHEAAVEAYDALPAAEQSERRHRDLLRQARRGLERGAEAAAAATAETTDESAAPVGDAPGQVELEILEGGWKILQSDARDRFDESYASIRALADRYPAWAEAQHLTAELAYRLSHWADSVKYFKRADRIVSQKPDLQFYLAVALYKSGDPAAASDMLDRCLPLIQSSEFVNFWVERIRSATP